MSKKQSRARNGLLDGLKKVGKRFIPPMLQIAQMHQTSFVNVFSPNLFGSDCAMINWDTCEGQGNRASVSKR